MNTLVLPAIWRWTISEKVVCQKDKVAEFNRLVTVAVSKDQRIGSGAVLIQVIDQVNYISQVDYAVCIRVTPPQTGLNVLHRDEVTQRSTVKACPHNIDIAIIIHRYRGGHIKVVFWFAVSSYGMNRSHG